MTAEKAALRERMKAVRAAIPAEQARLAAEAVVAPILERLDHPSVLIYIGVRGELDTGPLLDALWAAGHRVSVPRITGPGTMVAAHLPSREALKPGRFGVPTSEEPVSTDVSAVIVPGLAFDRGRGRLGYGAGFYDRWLAGRARRVQSIGLGFDQQLVDAVPMDPHDQRLDAVITPSFRVG